MLPLWGHNSDARPVRKTSKRSPAKQSARSGKDNVKISQDVLTLFNEYWWLGKVPELT
jgi:hypothetical protein